MREAAAYALAFLFDRRANGVLVEVLVDQQEEAKVRAQAAEALGNLFELSDRRLKEFRRTAIALTSVLTDAAPQVRFWAAFALGQMRFSGALPALEQLAATDETVCPDWWSVREEALNTITHIRTGRWPEPDAFQRSQNIS